MFKYKYDRHSAECGSVSLLELPICCPQCGVWIGIDTDATSYFFNCPQCRARIRMILAATSHILTIVHSVYRHRHGCSLCSYLRGRSRCRRPRCWCWCWRGRSAGIGRGPRHASSAAGRSRSPPPSLPASELPCPPGGASAPRASPALASARETRG